MRWLSLRIYVLAVVTLLLTGMSVFAGTVPNTLNFQGTLYDGTGQAVTGTKEITVSLYSVLSGGTPFWTETQAGVIIKSGNFSVALGKDPGNPITQANLSGTTYIGIKVDSDAEMVPRQQFTSVAYALKSGDGVPVGAIVMWSGPINELPSGWALCDGANGTPDLRDRFIVGAGSGYTVGAKGGTTSVNLAHSHTVNSHSHPIGHTHTYSGTTSTYDARTGVTDDGSNQHDMSPSHAHTFGGTTSGSDQGDSGASSPGTNSQLSTAQDIRPPYYALAFIIKLQ